MPAACSFDDGKCMTRHVNSNLVNEHLQWNPYPLDREARQEVLWNRRSASPTQPLEREQRLRYAKHWAEFYGQRLTEHHAGRVVLAAEDPGHNRMDPQYWLARADFYKAEYERLEEEDYNRASRSVTPEIYHPDMFGETELDQTEGYAENAAGRLATLPAGMALLDAEDHGESATDPEYWRRKEREYTAV